jgi:hypothetical protein
MMMKGESERVVVVFFPPSFSAVFFLVVFSFSELCQADVAGASGLEPGARGRRARSPAWGARGVRKGGMERERERERKEVCF